MTASLFLSSLFSPSLPFHLDSCTNNSLSFHVSIIPNWSLRKRERVCGATLFIELRTPLVSSWNQYFEDLDIFFSNIKFRSIYLQEKNFFFRRRGKIRKLIFVKYYWSRNFVKYIEIFDIFRKIWIFFSPILNFVPYIYKKKIFFLEEGEKLENWFLWNIIEVETSWNISKFLIYFERFGYFFLQY